MWHLKINIVQRTVGSIHYRNALEARKKCVITFSEMHKKDTCMHVGVKRQLLLLLNRNMYFSLFLYLSPERYCAQIHCVTFHKSPLSWHKVLLCLDRDSVIGSKYCSLVLNIRGVENLIKCHITYCGKLLIAKTNSVHQTE